MWLGDAPLSAAKLAVTKCASSGATVTVQGLVEPEQVPTPLSLLLPPQLTKCHPEAAVAVSMTPVLEE